ncbi:hypothetical protein [Arthrobacter sp. 18067]|uniref:hypothetical protein n=1 Tax=Arthrobacter sp. 18067 TaxID=2681413 RepID=UPI00135991F2|nr:hypothetical protein [Arthrobacter sp. 18067]
MQTRGLDAGHLVPALRATSARTVTTAAITVTVVLMAAPAVVVATPSEVSDTGLSKEQ